MPAADAAEAIIRVEGIAAGYDGNAIPDFHGRTPHASLGGRSLCAAPFDGRRLGARIADLKPPLPETTLWGMGIASGAELRHFFNAMRKPASFWVVAKRVLAHWKDLLLHRRGMRLLRALRREPRGGFGDARRVIAADRHGGAGAAHLLGDGIADAVAGAGDDGDLAGEPSGEFSARGGLGHLSAPPPCR